MDLPINQAYNALNKANSDWIANPIKFNPKFTIYRNSIPNDDTVTSQNASRTGSALMLIRESSNEPGEYANNNVKSQLIGVELQLFYQAYFDVQKSELQVQKVMIDAGWRMTTSRPHVWDPDTNWLTKTMYFEKTETLKESDYK